jgi:hypothetical protein
MNEKGIQKLLSRLENGLRESKKRNGILRKKLDGLKKVRGKR